MRTSVKVLALLIGAGVLYLVAPGAIAFVKEYGPPFFGVLILVAMAGILIYALRELYGGPVHRAMRKLADSLEYRRQRLAAGRELKRRALSAEETQRVRMLSLSARVYEQAASALSDGKLLHELEDLKARSERVLLRAQAHEIERFLLRYQVAFTRLSSSPNLSAGEKAKLIEEMRELMRSEIEGESAGEDPTVPSSHLTGEERWEYRTPGTDPVMVSAQGLRRLVEKGYLGGEDECRRAGTDPWQSVVAHAPDPSPEGDAAETEVLPG